MSGIRTGTRLEQLRALHRQITVRTELARRRGHHEDVPDLHDLAHKVAAAIRDEERAARARPTVAVAVRVADERVTRHLVDLGVTAHDVKVWAVTQGIIPAVVRGRVSGRLVDAYAAHHQHQETAS